MAYKLTKEERETIILFDESADTASLDTSSLPMMRKMEKLRKEFPEAYRVVRQDEYGTKYEFPKNLISIRRPRTHKMTDTQKKEVAERLIKARENNK